MWLLWSGFIDRVRRWIALYIWSWWCRWHCAIISDFGGREYLEHGWLQNGGRTREWNYEIKSQNMKTMLACQCYCCSLPMNWTVTVVDSLSFCSVFCLLSVGGRPKTQSRMPIAKHKLTPFCWQLPLTNKVLKNNKREPKERTKNLTNMIGKSIRIFQRKEEGSCLTPAEPVQTAGISSGHVTWRHPYILRTIIPTYR